MSVESIRILRILTPLSAIASSVAQTIAILSNEWLHSVELMNNPIYEKFTMPPEMEYNKKFTVSGLWQLCHNNPPKTPMHCFVIDYFSTDDYLPDPNDSTMAIPFAAKKAALFIFISSAILIIGELLCFLGHVCSRKRSFMFASGIAFIISGLMILAGIVIYISTFKSEVGNKLRPKSTFQDPIFDYNYGYSFIFAISSLMLCELTGTFSIFLFIVQHQLEYKSDIKKQQQFVDYLTFSPIDQQLSFMRHGSRGRRYSRTRELSRDASPCPTNMKSSRHGSLNIPNVPLSDSMRDLTYFNFPPFSRETTCNTVSTAVDINRDISRDFSSAKDYTRDYGQRLEFTYDPLRRTTPV